MRLAKYVLKSRVVLILNSLNSEILLNKKLLPSPPRQTVTTVEVWMVFLKALCIWNSIITPCLFGYYLTELQIRGGVKIFGR